MRVGVLISGRGSNMAALIAAAAEPGHPYEIAVVIANKADAGGLAVAQAAGIPTVIVSGREFTDRAAFDVALDVELRRHDVEIIALAGFMRILGAGFISGWPDRIVNIHPSLLPAFRGLDTHRRTLDAGCKVAGCTVHIVRAELDDGPILAQAVVPVLDDDDEASLAARILVEEHRIYPEAIRALADRRVTIDGMRTRIGQRRRLSR
ncbi:MAG: phosphoribosylglycinamide formyltransferase [Janthinobacterium lividum]